MRVLLLVALLAGCSKKSGEDKCTRVIEKSMKVLGELATMRGTKLGPKEKAQLVEQCRRQTRDGKPDAEMECVLAAKDDAAVRKCYIRGYEDYLARSKEVEAKLQLNKLGKNARMAFVATAQFPVGKVGPTPPAPCCTQQIKQCVPDEKMWADPVWQALEFNVEGAFNFQYSYESDGKTFTATAVGDIGCTGKPVTHTITGAIGGDGSPVVTGP